jgi:long-chain acyl-CoA synthetase
MNKEWTLRDLLSERAKKYGDKTFLYFKDLEVSYRQLEELVYRVANGLSAIGVKKGDKVCLLIPNQPEFIYAFLGAPTIGAVIVPINTWLKSEEIKYIIQNSDAETIITVPQLIDRVDGIRADIPQVKNMVFIGEPNPPGTTPFSRLLAAPAMQPTVALDPDDDASIIYTSGTTGKPKGVMLTHHNYVYDAAAGIPLLDSKEMDRTMCILPLFHVNGQVATVLGPLSVGSSVVLTEGFSPKTFFQDLARHRATGFSGVPTVYSILLNLPDADKYDLSALRVCICGAAPMPVEVFNKFEEKFKAYILEGYGLSEGTCVSTLNPYGGKRKIGSIGVALPGQELKIFDDQDQELPPGRVGEIVIRGDNVMKGYYRNPRASAETLRNGWLHTGDLGYVDEEGYFFIVGRKKEMIIRGGENIYPKEVEEVIYKHPAVAEAAVVGLPDPIWGEEVAAFIITKPEMRLSEEELINYCKERLADYKCPRKVFFIENFPKTATGKIQKGQVKELFLQNRLTLKEDEG